MSEAPGCVDYLLVMRNESQRDYAHGVPKTARVIGPRMNLTFREFHA